jgi:glycosyltransferase involved in cell wall biosynthesis
MVRAGSRADTVILSHINLLLVGWLIKKITPSVKLILLAHGIEIWYPLSSRIRNMLHHCDTVFTVSAYTQNKIMEVHQVSKAKSAVLNNCLDPFLPLPSLNKKNEKLLQKYGFNVNDFVLMTLTRLSSKERYKGYDKVFGAIKNLKTTYPNIKYLLAGSYDTAEKAFIDNLVEQTGLQNNVVMAGYLLDEELEDHFGISDVYIMPSRKEGFGIVFIEAMYYGLPVIAGNIDGSTDALLNGKLGQLVNPDSIAEITEAITNIIDDKEAFNPNRDLLMKHFSYEAYKQKLEDLIPATVLA